MNDKNNFNETSEFKRWVFLAIKIYPSIFIIITLFIGFIVWVAYWHNYSFVLITSIYLSIGNLLYFKIFFIKVQLLV